MSATVLQLKTQHQYQHDTMRADLVTELAARYHDASAADILYAVLQEKVAGDVALVSSFGAESSVLLHLAAQVKPDTPIIFLETGKHFAQTLSHKKKLINEFGLTNVLEIKPDQAIIQENDLKGDLWRHNADQCCDIRKVQPLKAALTGFDGWITGRKQFQNSARLRLPFFEDSGTHIKVNPLARLSLEDITTYMEQHNLPQHPLVAQGFPSIGCWPCTHPVTADEDVRAGRWRGQGKTECGIHL
ncbi:MAG: phosphoadenylyl-sulfate reductase [Aquisalinus sp.]|nr:phosphoadenylyl-sulfate reductase [Aquisalinus sp.]